MIIEETVSEQDLARLRDLEAQNHLSIDSVYEFDVDGETFADVQIHLETDVGEVVDFVRFYIQQIGKRSPPLNFHLT